MLHNGEVLPQHRLQIVETNLSFKTNAEPFLRTLKGPAYDRYDPSPVHRTRSTHFFL